MFQFQLAPIAFSETPGGSGPARKEHAAWLAPNGGQSGETGGKSLCGGHEKGRLPTRLPPRTGDLQAG